MKYRARFAHHCTFIDFLTQARKQSVIVLSLYVCLCVCVCVLQVNLCEYSILMLLGHCFQNANL